MSRLTLIKCAPQPYATARRPKVPDLKLIENDPPIETNAPAIKKDDNFTKALGVVESQLEGEAWFLDEVHKSIRHYIKVTNPHLPEKKQRTFEQRYFPTILATGTGHDNIIHVAQFFLFLEALNCTTAKTISAFIDNHNNKINDLLKGDNVAMVEETLRKAKFAPKRIEQVVRTFEHFKRPVFSVTELSDLLSDLISSRTIGLTLNELIDGGQIRVRPPDDRPDKTDARRRLVEPTEKFMGMYIESLLRTHDAITGTGG